MFSAKLIFYLMMLRMLLRERAKEPTRLWSAALESECRANTSNSSHTEWSSLTITQHPHYSRVDFGSYMFKNSEIFKLISQHMSDGQQLVSDCTPNDWNHCMWVFVEWSWSSSRSIPRRQGLMRRLWSSDLILPVLHGCSVCEKGFQHQPGLNK